HARGRPEAGDRPASPVAGADGLAGAALRAPSAADRRGGATPGQTRSGADIAGAAGPECYAGAGVAAREVKTSHHRWAGRCRRTRRAGCPVLLDIGPATLLRRHRGLRIKPEMEVTTRRCLIQPTGELPPPISRLPSF